MMDSDFSMVEIGDVVEYFRAVLNVFLKIFNLELDGNFKIGPIEVVVNPGADAE